MKNTTGWRRSRISHKKRPKVKSKPSFNSTLPSVLEAIDEHVKVREEAGYEGGPTFEGDWNFFI